MLDARARLENTKIYIQYPGASLVLFAVTEAECQCCTLPSIKKSPQSLSKDAVFAPSPSAHHGPLVKPKYHIHIQILIPFNNEQKNDKNFGPGVILPMFSSGLFILEQEL